MKGENESNERLKVREGIRTLHERKELGRFKNDEDEKVRMREFVERED